MTAQVAIENLMVNVACKVLGNIETKGYTCFNLIGYCHVGDNILFCVWCEPHVFENIAAMHFLDTLNGGHPIL